MEQTQTITAITLMVKIPPTPTTGAVTVTTMNTTMVA